MATLLAGLGSSPFIQSIGSGLSGGGLATGSLGSMLGSYLGGQLGQDLGPAASPLGGMINGTGNQQNPQAPAAPTYTPNNNAQAMLQAATPYSQGQQLGFSQLLGNLLGK